MLNMHPQVQVPVELFGLYSQLPRMLRWYGDLGRDFNRRLLATDLGYVGQLAQFEVRFDTDGFVRRLERAGTDLAAVVGCFYETLRATSGKPMLGDKTPNHAPHLALIERLFPAARVIHLLRDGRDCAASSARAREGFNRRNVYELARLWPRNNIAIAEFGERNPGRYHRLRYEDLITDPGGCLDRLCAFLELPFDAAMLNYEAGEFARGNAALLSQHANLARGILSDNREKWRTALDAREIGVYESIAGGALRRFGYPLSGIACSAPTLRLHCQVTTVYRRARRGLRTGGVEARQIFVLASKRLFNALGLPVRRSG